jgi:hypothetical protein
MPDSLSHQSPAGPGFSVLVLLGDKLWINPNPGFQALND